MVDTGAIGSVGIIYILNRSMGDGKTTQKHTTRIGMDTKKYILSKISAKVCHFSFSDICIFVVGLPF